jgi:hypothetical protein
MKIIRRTTILVMISILLPAVTGLALAQGERSASASPGAGYDLTGSSVDGGGYTFSTGGGYTLGGTIGQPDAGALIGGGYTLGGGFWGGGALSGQSYPVYLPLVRRQSP